MVEGLLNRQSILRVFLEETPEKVTGILGDEDVRNVQIDFASPILGDHAGQLVGGKQQLSEEHHIDDAAQREHVALLSRGFPVQHFGGDEAGGATFLDFLQLVTEGREEVGEAEVDKHDVLWEVLAGSGSVLEHDVVGLDVTVDETAGVDLQQSQQNAFDHVHLLLQVQLFIPQLSE